MFSKRTFLALCTLAASSVSVQAKQSFETETFCATATIAISTVVHTHTQTVVSTHTVTSTAVSSTSTSASSSSGSSSSSNNSGSSSSSSSNNSGSSSSNNNSGSSSSSSSSSGSSNNSGSNNSGSAVTTSDSVAASTSSAVLALSTAGSSTTTAVLATSTGGVTDATAAQTSLTLDPNVICPNFTDDGQNPPVTGQSASQTSTNNYINFCALTLPGTPLTNGAQVTTGSCNPVPIGSIPSTSNMPSSKFQFPKNFGTVDALVPFNLTMKIRGMQTGAFTNAASTYYAAPQQLNSAGQIIGHTHFVVESLSTIDQTTPNDARKFVFFKGINNAADSNGLLSTSVTAGLPVGSYRVCSINTAMNHQPAIVPIAQHGSLDDCSYVSG
ncbi:unnamed protein product [Mycena citricolor]|uniref:Ribosomal protein s17 n=1 Tax=Mycena citricolor TaxID=2018698 RepID=A0AAD2H7N5_9AGAR|nr:unnamed protein product [Mycena citricolor]